MSRLTVLLIAGLLAVASLASAQTVQVPYPVPATYKLGWDHATPATVDRFESRLLPATWTDVGKVACPAPSTSSFCQPFPTIPSPGMYTVEVRACNVAGCSAATPFAFAAVAAPATAPTNVRVIP